MPAVTLGSVSLATQGTFTGGGKWVEGGSAGAPSYEKGYPDSAGTDGVAVKHYGFRGRTFVINARYSGSGENTAIAAAMTDQATLADDSFTAVIAGVSFPACYLDESQSSVDLRAKGAGGGYYWCDAVFTVVQKRLS